MASSRPPEASKPSAFQPVSLSFRRTRSAAREEWTCASVRKRVRTSTCVRAPSIEEIGSLDEAPVGRRGRAGDGDGHRLDDLLDDPLGSGRRRDGVLEERRDEVLREEVLRLRGDALRGLRDQLVDLVPGVGQLGLPAREVVLEKGREGLDEPAVGDGVDGHGAPLLGAFGVAKAHYRRPGRRTEPPPAPALTRTPGPVDSQVRLGPASPAAPLRARKG